MRLFARPLAALALSLLSACGLKVDADPAAAQAEATVTVDPSTKALAQAIQASAERLTDGAERIAEDSTAAAVQIATTGQDPYGLVTPARVERVQQAGMAAAKAVLGDHPIPERPTNRLRTGVAPDFQFPGEGRNDAPTGPPGIGWFRHGPPPSPVPPAQ